MRVFYNTADSPPQDVSKRPHGNRACSPLQSCAVDDSSGLFCIWHTIPMAWEVEFTDEFRAWWNMLTEGQQDDLAHSVRYLMEFGPALRFPHTSKVTSSRYPQMRELRTQSAGRPLRTLYAFNPLRTAVLLIGGDKTGDDRWYDKFVPVADRLFEEHLSELKKEGKL